MADIKRKDRYHTEFQDFMKISQYMESIIMLYTNDAAGYFRERNKMQMLMVFGVLSFLLFQKIFQSSSECLKD